MASASSPGPFEKGQVSSDITENHVVQFFQQHGIFYEQDAEIGRLAETLGAEGLDNATGIAKFKEVYMRKPRCGKLLEHFHSDFAFVIGADGYYYAATTSEEGNQGRMLVLMLRPNTVVEFAKDTHKKSFKSVVSPYRLCIIPYKQIRGLTEIPIDFEEGGILVTHPRLAFRPEKGSGYGYAGRNPDFTSQQP